MDTYTRYQGDSLWVDYTIKKISLIDPTWSNWTGVWNITSSVGGPELLSGSLLPSSVEGKFYLRIGPATNGTSWTTLPVGVYLLNIQIDCAVVDYRQEDRDTLIIIAQGKV